jgi:Smg protein
MKENVFDVLMYLFENYMDTEPELNPDRETLREELSEAGFPSAEIGKAFSWLEELAEQQESLPVHKVRTGISIRVYSEEEQARVDLEGRGFLMFLEQVGVLDPATRELVIDRVMALDSDDTDLDQIKWIVLMVLFNQPGREAAFVWMEDMVMNGGLGTAHLH